MKKTALCMAVFSLLVLFTPVAGLLLSSESSFGPALSEDKPGGGPTITSPWAESAPTAQGDDASPAPPQAPPEDGLLYVWDEGQGQLLGLTPLEYMVGAVASEMPVAWPDEALRAQGVASHSYLLFQKEHGGAEANNGGFITVNSSLRQGYMTQDVMESYWGEAFQENLARLQEVLAPVEALVLTYDGSPAAACYHAISGGATEASQNVWGEALPYLQGVDSPLDLTSPDYEASVTYPAADLKALLENAGLGCELADAPQSWAGPASYTAAGYVETMEWGGVPIAGTQLRALLGLRSACFSVEYQEDAGFVFTTHGYGHGVGLSQYGAKALALTGKSCREILETYFPGTLLQESAGD